MVSINERKIAPVDFNMLIFSFLDEPKIAPVEFFQDWIETLLILLSDLTDQFFNLIFRKEVFK